MTAFIEPPRAFSAYGCKSSDPDHFGWHLRAILDPLVLATDGQLNSPETRSRLFTEFRRALDGLMWSGIIHEATVICDNAINPPSSVTAGIINIEAVVKLRKWSNPLVYRAGDPVWISSLQHH